MNPIVRDHLVARMREGRRVLAVLETPAQVASEVEFLSRYLTDDQHGEVVRRARGAEGMQGRDGGWIQLRTVRSQAERGLTADLVYLDCDATGELVARYYPVVASVPGGEVIGR